MLEHTNGKCWIPALELLVALNYWGMGMNMLVDQVKGWFFCTNLTVSKSW
jgi:hypothetical protein